MKLKLTIALVILALVLGMVLVACDDGDLPKIEPKEKDGAVIETIYDTDLIPYLDKDGNTQNATIADTVGTWYYNNGTEYTDADDIELLPPGRAPNLDKSDILSDYYVYSDSLSDYYFKKYEPNL